MIVDSPQLAKDGVLTLEMGMSSGRSPTLLKEEECAYALNATMRGGYARNRPVFQPLTLSGPGLAAWQTSNFQGIAFYDLGDGQQTLIGMSSGKLFKIDIVGTAATVTALGPADSLNSPVRPLAYFCQADVYMVVQDGSATPLILSGTDPANVRRAAVDEVPVGRAMAYGQGRLWVSMNRLLAAGDIFGGPNAVIKFTENTYLTETTPSPQSGFGTPLQSGDIVGLNFLEMGDTATGQGELLVFCRKNVWSVQAQVPRTSWTTTQRMLSVALTNVGGTGHRAITNVNGDCFFRSKEGWRAYRLARNEQFYSESGINSSWGYTPISLEMKRVINSDTVQLMDYASSVLFRGRLLGLAHPVPYQHSQAEGTFSSAYFTSIVALDFEIVSGMRGKQPPAWDGEWQGLNVLQLLANDFTYQERCFAFCRNTTTDTNEIWEITTGELYDANAQKVTTVIETRALDCKKPKNIKRLRRGDCYFNNVLADTEVEISYKSDGYPNWIPWHSFTIHGQGSLAGTPGGSNLCNIPSCSVPGFCPDPAGGGVQPGGGYWFQQRLPTPDTACDPSTNKLLRNGFYFQFQITWKGPALLEAFIIHTDELVENPNGGCP